MNSENKDQPLFIQDGRVLNSLLAKLVTKGVLFAMILVVVTLIQAFFYGMTGRSLILLLGAILSGLALFAYISFAAIKGKAEKPKNGFLSLSFVLIGFIPYLFGVYLFLYEGLWRFTRLSNGFSIRVIIAALFYTVAGYIIVGAIYRASEFGRAVSEGRIKIQ